MLCYDWDVPVADLPLVDLEYRIIMALAVSIARALPMTDLKRATRQHAAFSALLGVLGVAAPAAVPSAEHATIGDSPRLLRIIKPVMVDVVRTVDLRSMSFEEARMSDDQVKALDAFLI